MLRLFPPRPEDDSACVVLPCPARRSNGGLRGSAAGRSAPKQAGKSAFARSPWSGCTDGFPQGYVHRSSEGTSLVGEAEGRPEEEEERS